MTEPWTFPTWTPPDPTPTRIDAAVWRALFVACVAVGLVVTLAVKVTVLGPQTAITRVDREPVVLEVDNP